MGQKIRVILLTKYVLTWLIIYVQKIGFVLFRASFIFARNKSKRQKNISRTFNISCIEDLFFVPKEFLKGYIKKTFKFLSL